MLTVLTIHTIGGMNENWPMITKASRKEVTRTTRNQPYKAFLMLVAILGTVTVPKIATIVKKFFIGNRHYLSNISFNELLSLCLFVYRSSMTK